jgi:hypothetical protein
MGAVTSKEGVRDSVGLLRCVEVAVEGEGADVYRSLYALPDRRAAARRAATPA